MSIWPRKIGCCIGALVALVGAIRWWDFWDRTLDEPEALMKVLRGANAVVAIGVGCVGVVFGGLVGWVVVSLCQSWLDQWREKAQ